VDAQSLLHVFSNGATAAGTVLSHGFQVSLDKCIAGMLSSQMRCHWLLITCARTAC